MPHRPTEHDHPPAPCHSKNMSNQQESYTQYRMLIFFIVQKPNKQTGVTNEGERKLKKD